MSRGYSLLIALACVTGPFVAARGQQVPPPEAGDKVVSAKLIGDEVEMRDAENGAPIMIPKGVPLWQGKSDAASFSPTIDFQAQPTGFDVIYTFVNNGPGPRKLGCLSLGILTLGHAVTYPDLGGIGAPLTADYNENYKVRPMHYPEALYSPAWVLENKDYAVGMTIQYPVLDYKHSVRLCLYAPEGKFAQGEGGRGWKLEFLLSNLGAETDESRLVYPGLIEPGETRVYVVSVRVTKKTNEWVRTLAPYRNWFQGQYGGVTYTRQGRCIAGNTFASGEACSDENPYGFGDSRPDLNGWSGIVAGCLEKRGWDTLLFLTPSGSYRSNPANNPPYQFATNWNATEPLATADDPDIGFPRLAAAKRKIGFWWGHSLQVADRWDDEAPAPFDPTNADHRKLAFAEMDLAVKAGATTIVLDAFSPKTTPVWELLTWLRDLKARYPAVRFCAEPVCSDLVHREIATVYRGDRPRSEVVRPEDIDGFSNPHFLADFLLPGHETWGSFRWGAYEELFGTTFTDQEKTDKLRQIASLGFTPCSMDAFTLLDAGIEAARSWETTVPLDLQGRPDRGGVAADGDVDADDPFPTFKVFDAAFKAGDAAADLNADGALNLFDYSAWQGLHPPSDQDVVAADDQAASGKEVKPTSAKAGKTGKKAPRQASKPSGPRADARRSPSGRKAKKPSSPSRLEIKVTDTSPKDGSAAPEPPRRGFFIHAPISFSYDEIAAAIARAKGLDDSAYEQDAQAEAAVDEKK